MKSTNSYIGLGEAVKVTLDTNVLVSGTFWTGDSFRIMDLIDQKKIICVLSKEILGEYKKVLLSDEIIEKTEKKNLDKLEIAKKVIANSEIFDSIVRLNVVKDPDDNKIIEAAVEGKCSYIISQDKHLLDLKSFRDIKIISPSDFLALLKEVKCQK